MFSLINWVKLYSHFLLRVPTFYMENPEIPVGKSNGTHHSIWSTSEIMGY